MSIFSKIINLTVQTEKQISLFKKCSRLRVKGETFYDISETAGIVSFEGDANQGEGNV